jgi:two-component sensor histidine kinase
MPAFFFHKHVPLLKKVFYTLLGLGIEDKQSSHDKRRIKTTNLINLIMILFIMIGYTNYFILKKDFPFFTFTSFLLLAVLSLFLNKIKKTDLSFLLFTININLSIFFTNKYYPIEVGAYLFYFPLIVSVVLLNNPSLKDKHSIIHFSICILFFLTNLLFDFPAFQLQTLSPDQTKLLWYYDLVMSASITAVLSFLLTRIIYTQNREIIVQNEDLKNAKETVNTSLREKEILLAELHHRVKNNLAIISGLLNLQEDATPNIEAKQIISDSKTRILSMALVHKMLYENAELKSIDLGKYAAELIYELFYSYNLLKTVTVTEDYDHIVLPVNKSIPLGLILNEVVTNSIKYAFKSLRNQKGIFNVSIKLNESNVNLIIKDNGPGFTKDFNPDSDTLSLGIYLVKTLAEQIDGKVEFTNDNGAKIELNFTLN